MSNFLQKQYTDEDLKKLVSHLEFDNFKNNKSVNMESLRDLGMLLDNDQKCIRAGKTGSSQQYFDPDMNIEANKWIEENLKKTNIEFPLNLI